MLPKVVLQAPKRVRGVRSYGTAKGHKVAVLGAAGGIGQPLSMLLKTYPHGFDQLALYDVVNTPGVAADLSHIPTPVKVTGHVGDAQLEAALQGAEIVVIPAGVPRKPGMTRDDLFNTNASIVAKLAYYIAKTAPKANVLIISNPVNSTVPIAAEIFKSHGLNAKKIFGVTSLDVIRANTFLGEAKGLDPTTLDVPVVGGHAGPTILPLFSQVPGVTLTQEQLEKLTHRVQYGGDEVVQAKAGTGSATLSMAVAAYRFTKSLLRAIHGEKVTECAYVESTVVPGVSFFASKVELGSEGPKAIHPVGTLSEFEQLKFKEVVPELQKNIAKGVDFAKGWKLQQ